MDLGLGISGTAAPVSLGGARPLAGSESNSRAKRTTASRERGGSQKQISRRESLQSMGALDKENRCRLDYAGWSNPEAYQAEHGDLVRWPNGLIKKTRKNCAEFGMFYWRREYELQHMWG